MMIMNKELNLLLARDKELFCNRQVKNCSFLLSDKKLKNSFFFNRYKGYCYQNKEQRKQVEKLMQSKLS